MTEKNDARIPDIKEKGRAKKKGGKKMARSVTAGTPAKDGVKKKSKTNKKWTLLVLPFII